MMHLGWLGILTIGLASAPDDLPASLAVDAPPTAFDVPTELATANARSLGDAAEANLNFAEAVRAFRTCTQGASDRDRRYCSTRLAALAPQSGDNFAGWRALAEVRRDRAQLDDAQARARVQAALEANPTGPAADELRRWLVHLDVSRGVLPAVEINPADQAWVAERTAAREQLVRHRTIGLVAGSVAASCVAWSLRRKEPLATRSALAAAALVGLLPALVAAGWNADLFAPFLRNAFVVWLATLLAPRLHPALAVTGTIAGLLANAAASDWLVSLGVP